MLNFKNALEVLHDDNNTFIDHKDAALDLVRDSFPVEMVASEDFIYVGFYKPINSVYLDIETVNTASGAITGKYFNGTEFVTIANFYDETSNLSRNGFMSWSRNQEDEASTEINGTTAFWYQLKASADTSEVIINMINIMFCDDRTLLQKNPRISHTSFLAGQPNHNKTHLDVRDEIVEHFRGMGKVKIDTRFQGEISVGSIDPWDLLDIFEVRTAAKYGAMACIYLNFSDDPNDSYWKKYEEYRGFYNEFLGKVSISLDKDDDGVEDPNEKVKKSTVVYVTR